MHTNPLKETLSDPFARIGLILLATIFLLAAFAPLLCASSPDDYTGLIFSAPSFEHPLGTDSMGQDIWTRLLYGARTSLVVALAAAILSTSLSILIGTSAALIGGCYEQLWMRTVDAMTSIPSIIVIILLAAYLRPSLMLLILFLATFSWPGGARVVRSFVLAGKERMHVHAARTFGAGNSHILKAHIIPDLGPIIASLMIQNARRAVFMEAGLAFLGVSDPGVISWGKMMHQALAFTYLDVWMWWLVPAGLALSLTLIGISFIGFSLETAMNPRLARDYHPEAGRC